MATDIEEFESAIMLVCNAYKDLKIIDSCHPLLSLVELEKVGFKATPQYQEKYVRPNLRNSDGQLAFWDWVYPNQFEAKLKGLLDYKRDISSAIKKEEKGE